MNITMHHKRGQAMITAIILFLVGSTILLGGIVVSSLADLRIADNLEFARGSYYLAEGVVEDVGYRLKNRVTVSTVESLSEGDVKASATTTDVSGEKEVVAEGDTFSRERTVKLNLALGDGTAFNYGVQVGGGGLQMNNSSSVRGNAFSNGPIIVNNSGTIYGDVISAGTSGMVSGLTATGSVSAHTIQNSTIGKDAYYVSISGSSVGGTSHPGSPDQATSSLPIEESMIDDWEDGATAGGVYSSPCPYNISGGSVTLGPIKINCDLNISGSSVVSLAGPVWVNGNISISNNAVIKTDSSVGAQSVALIADKPTAPLTSGTITLSNSTVFIGTGGGYVLLLSQNAGAENGQSTKAIRISNSVSGDLLLYAGHGEIELSNSIQLKEVTAYKISMQNSAQVIYEKGLANTFFTSGPGGGFDIQSWSEQ